MTPGKLSTDQQDPERLRELTRLIGLRLHRDPDAISDGMTGAIEAAIGELDESGMRASLHASVSNNVEVIIELLTLAKEVFDLPLLPHAHRYAEELAQQDVPESALRRAYHVGSNHLLARIFDQVQEIDCQPHEQLPLYHHLAGWLYRYVDEITRGVIATYQEEKRSSHERAARTTITWVNRVLNGEDVSSREFAAATGYRLDKVHVGGRVWIEEPVEQAALPSANLSVDPPASAGQVGHVPAHSPALTQLIEQIRRQLGADQDPLVVMAGRREADVWFAYGRSKARVDARAFDDLVEGASGARIAFGSPGVGPAGFRSSWTQAHQAARIARVATSEYSRVTSYADEGIPVIARLTEDIPATRHLVRDILGELATDSDSAARQRETMRVFHEFAFSYSATASQLLLHRNTVRYRLEKAEQQLGRGVTERPLDTQLALALCHVLGKVVLVPESGAGSNAQGRT